MSSWFFNGRSDRGGEHGDGKEGSEIAGGRVRVEITRPHVYR